MRIALIVPSLHGGGAEFVASQWASYLRAQGDTVTVLATHSQSDDDCEIIIGASFGARLRHLRMRLQQDSFDAILSLAPHWNLLAVMGAMGLKPKPRVLISGRTMEAESLRMGKNKKAEIILAKRLYRLADGFIAISHSTAAEAQAMFGVQNEKIWVIPNPATAKVDQESTVGRRAGIAGGASETLDIVVPGRLVPGKRPWLAINVAVECARTTGRRVCVHFFGRGIEQDLVEHFSHDRVDLVFHGWVDRWFDEAPKPSIVLLASRIEGFANVLVEAASVGLPSVASSRALGVADAIIPGVTGVLTLTDSVSAFARAVIEAEGLPPMDVDRWLAQFSLESSGSKLRQALVAGSG